MTSAGIIAAGDGSRLRESHPGLVKPLVPVAGVPLCHWVVRSLAGAGARRITVLVNSRGVSLKESLPRAFPDLSWSFLTADTPSSWQSFRLVAGAVAREAPEFFMSTVDALVAPQDVVRFAREARESGAPAALALTGFIDDEKPLWADRGPDGLITALGPSARRREHATAGLYYMTRGLAETLPAAAAHDSLRSYWTSLHSGGVRIAGPVLGKTLDVDRPEDVAQASIFAREALSREEAPR